MIFYSILCGLTGFMIVEILCRPFEVLGWWPPLLRKILFGSTAVRDFEDMAWWQLALYKPLAGCGKCFAGWFSIVVYLLTFQVFIFPDTVFFIIGAIFTAWVLEKNNQA